MEAALESSSLTLKAGLRDKGRQRKGKRKLAVALGPSAPPCLAAVPHKAALLSSVFTLSSVSRGPRFNSRSCFQVPARHTANSCYTSCWSEPILLAWLSQVWVTLYRPHDPNSIWEKSPYTRNALMPCAMGIPQVSSNQAAAWSDASKTIWCTK